jgi:hypothetical protein
MKEFPTSVAMSAITGFVVHEPFSDVHECLTYMAGEAVWTHQLPRIGREAQAWAVIARPDLTPAIDEAKAITKENWRDVLAVWLDRYGATIALPMLSLDQHESIDPVSELTQMNVRKIVTIIKAGSETP